MRVLTQSGKGRGKSKGPVPAARRCPAIRGSDAKCIAEAGVSLSELVINSLRVLITRGPAILNSVDIPMRNSLFLKNKNSDIRTQVMPRFGRLLRLFDSTFFRCYFVLVLFEDFRMKRDTLGEFPEQRLVNRGSYCVLIAAGLLAMSSVVPAAAGEWPTVMALLMWSAGLIALSTPLSSIALTMRRMRALRELSARLDALSKKIEEKPTPERGGE